MRLAYAAIFALVAAVFLPYSAAAAQPSSQGAGGLSSIVEIERYLTSMRVDFGGATIQLGSRNYAGANCPGSGWNCTTASVVIQFGNTNFAEVRDCTEPGIVLGDRCTILQETPPSGGNNMARCFIDTRDVPIATQVCNITQTNANGGDNNAEVHLVVKQKTGSTQNADQTANVMQTQLTGAGKNSSKVEETVDQDSRDGTTQDAFQRVNLMQTSISGRNFSDVRQSQKQGLDTKELTDAVQNQNTTCSGPNVSASVTQNSETGANESQLHQSTDQDEKAEKAVTGTQSQGCSGGGLDGDVTQDSGGVSRSVNHQTEKQTQKAKKDGGVVQTQIGPVFCCSQQFDNPANRFQINQTSDQSSNGTVTSQQTSLVGTYDTSGDGMVRQRAMNNDESERNECSGNSCDIFIFCGGEGCFAGEGD